MTEAELNTKIQAIEDEFAAEYKLIKAQRWTKEQLLTAISLRVRVHGCTLQTPKIDLICELVEAKINAAGRTRMLRRSYAYLQAHAK